MNLTNEEIKDIADRMDHIMWVSFHDIVCDVYLQRTNTSDDWEISDVDIIKVKQELKKYL